MRLRKLNIRLPVVLTASLALWIALLPLISAVHMAMVPHVYSREHSHFHEVVTSGKIVPVDGPNPATACIVAHSSASLLTSIEECPLCDLALRQGAVFSQRVFPKLSDSLIQDVSPPCGTHTDWPVLYRAPKHSPPFQAA